MLAEASEWAGVVQFDAGQPSGLAPGVPGNRASVPCSLSIPAQKMGQRLMIALAHFLRTAPGGAIKPLARGERFAANQTQKARRLAGFLRLVGRLGIEPRLGESESPVLPIRRSAIEGPLF